MLKGKEASFIIELTIEFDLKFNDYEVITIINLMWSEGF